MATATMIVMTPDPHRPEQAVDSFGTHGNATCVRPTVRAHTASSFVSVPFFVAPRRPPPRPELPRHAPDHGARTPFGRTTRSLLCQPTAWPSVAILGRKPCPTTRKSAALPHSTPTG